MLCELLCESKKIGESQWIPFTICYSVSSQEQIPSHAVPVVPTDHAAHPVVAGVLVPVETAVDPVGRSIAAGQLYYPR